MGEKPPTHPLPAAHAVLFSSTPDFPLWVYPSLLQSQPEKGAYPTTRISCTYTRNRHLNSLHLDPLYTDQLGCHPLSQEGCPSAHPLLSGAVRSRTHAEGHLHVHRSCCFSWAGTNVGNLQLSNTSGVGWVEAWALSAQCPSVPPHPCRITSGQPHSHPVPPPPPTQLYLLTGPELTNTLRSDPGRGSGEYTNDMLLTRNRELPAE